MYIFSEGNNSLVSAAGVPTLAILGKSRGVHIWLLERCHEVLSLQLLQGDFTFAVI